MSKTKQLEANKEEIIRKYYDGVSTAQLGKENGCSGALVHNFLVDSNVTMKENMKKKNLELKPLVIELYEKEKLTAPEIIKKLDMNPRTVYRYLKEAGAIFIDVNESRGGVPLKNFTAEIIDDYLNNGLGCFKLSKKYNCTESAISRLLHRNNIEINGPERKYNFDENFFHVIDTPEKAYVFGLLAADGCMNKNGARLGMTDKDIVYKVRDVMNHDGKITEVLPTGKMRLPQYKLDMNSVILSADLSKLGFDNKKTTSLKFPSTDIVPANLIRHWIRGFHDGDGSLIAPTPKGNRYIFKFVGTVDVIRGLERCITDNLNFPVSVFPTTNTKIEMLQLACGTRSYVKKFLDWIYEDSTIHMDRKYQRYQEFLKWYEEAPKHGACIT